MNTWHIAQTSFGLVGEDGEHTEHLSGHHCLACAYTHLVLEYGGDVDLRGLFRYGSCYQFLAVVVHNIRRDAEPPKNPAAVALGSIKSEKRAQASRKNGKLGGRPKS